MSARLSRRRHGFLAPAAVLLVVGTLTLAAGPAEAAPGDLDPSFGGDGAVAIAGFVGDAIALQPNGKIVVAGFTADARLALARYNRDGSLDTSFGFGGIVITSFGANAQAARDVALQPNGKIVAAGTAGEDLGGAREFALARYNRDGSPDLTFGGDGRVTASFGVSINDANAVALQPGGKIVAAGYAPGAVGGDFALARFNRDGSLDTSFSSDGRLATDFGLRETATDVAVQPGGRIVAAGFAGGVTFDDDFALARYNPDGGLDMTFGSDGKVTTDFGATDGAGAVALQPGGKAVAVGATLHGSGAIEFALARYNPDGALDGTFGGDGTVTTSFGANQQIANAVALGTGGRIVVAGLANNRADDDIALARYDCKGSLDPSFSGDGRVTTDFGGVSQSAHDMAVQPDGRIVVVSHDALVRYLGR
jgi:uncharacterized delta-60 repeat protein